MTASWLTEIIARAERRIHGHADVSFAVAPRAAFDLVKCGTLARGRSGGSSRLPRDEPRLQRFLRQRNEQGLSPAIFGTSQRSDAARLGHAHPTLVVHP